MRLCVSCLFVTLDRRRNVTDVGCIKREQADEMNKLSDSPEWRHKLYRIEAVRLIGKCGLYKLNIRLIQNAVKQKQIELT